MSELIGNRLGLCLLTESELPNKIQHTWLINFCLPRILDQENFVYA